MIGFRAWRLQEPHPDRDGPLLGAVGLADYVWRRGVAVAECKADFGGFKDIPSWPHMQTHQCGFWAMHQPDALPEVCNKWEAAQVLGVIAGYGHIQKHKTGFRASQAQILKIYLAPIHRAYIQALADFYECEVDWVMYRDEAFKDMWLWKVAEGSPYADR